MPVNEAPLRIDRRAHLHDVRFRIRDALHEPISLRQIFPVQIFARKIGHRRLFGERDRIAVYRKILAFSEFPLPGKSRTDKISVGVNSRFPEIDSPSSNSITVSL